MFRRFATKRRSAKHDHEFVVHNVGADLQRQVCSICGQVSIKASPPAGIRPTIADAEHVLFQHPPLTVIVDETVAPASLSWQYADRRTGR